MDAWMDDDDASDDNVMNMILPVRMRMRMRIRKAHRGDFGAQ